MCQARLWAQVAESKSWQFCKELPLKASPTSVSLPIARHTIAKSLLSVDLSAHFDKSHNLGGL